MITKKEFEKIKESISNFKFHSMEYTEFEDVAKHDIICNDDNLILIYGYNEQDSLYQYNYAFNDHKDFVKALSNCKKDDLLTFVNKEWVEDLRRIGFDIYVVDYTKDCNIIVKKKNGIIAGIICV